MKFINFPQLIKGFVDAVPVPKQRLPRVIQLPVNDICNSRCQMCHIWKQKLGEQLTVEQYRAILSNPLFRNVSSVGVNGGEPTLRKDLPEVVGALVEMLPQLASINLITNCIQHKRVIASIDELARICAEKDIHLDVMASLDGIGEVHDRVRGIKGNFEAVVRVLDHIQAHEQVGSSRIGCTVIRDNVYDVENVLAWCEDRSVYARFRLGIPHQRLYGKGISDPFALTWEERFHFAAFLDHLYLRYEKNENRRSFYRSLRDQIIYEKPRTAGCAWKHQGVTLAYDGALAYCAVESKELGNLLEEDAESLYWSNAKHLSEIVRDKCSDCLHDYDGISNREDYVMNLGKRVLQKMPTFARDAVRTSSRWRRISHENKRFKSVQKAQVNSSRGVVRRASERALICGWYGTETLGDKAILGGIVNGLREVRPNIQIDLAAIEPYVSRNTLLQMPELEIESVHSLRQAKRLIREGHYGFVIMGGGPLMAAVSECIDILELFALGRSAGAKTIVAGCGVGPLGNETRNAIIGEILALADVVLLRDDASIQLSRERLGFKGEARRILDPAFFWIYDRLKQASTQPGQGGNEQVLLALRDWPIHEYGAGLDRHAAREIKSRFEQELQAFVIQAQEIGGGVEVVPFCMHKLAVGGDDRAFYRRVFASQPTLLKQMDHRHRTPEQDLNSFRTSRAVLAMRFHSVVFSLATSRPFLAIDYTRGGKVAGLLNDLELTSQLVSLSNFNGKVAVAELLGPLPAVTHLPEKIEASRSVLLEAMRTMLS